MFEERENIELLELLSQVRAAALEEEDANAPSPQSLRQSYGDGRGGSASNTPLGISSFMRSQQPLPVHVGSVCLSEARHQHHSQGVDTSLNKCSVTAGITPVSPSAASASGLFMQAEASLWSDIKDPCYSPLHQVNSGLPFFSTAAAKPLFSEVDGTEPDLQVESEQNQLNALYGSAPGGCTATPTSALLSPPHTVPKSSQQRLAHCPAPYISFFSTSAVSPTQSWPGTEGHSVHRYGTTDAATANIFALPSPPRPGTANEALLSLSQRHTQTQYRQQPALAKRTPVEGNASIFLSSIAKHAEGRPPHSPKDHSAGGSGRRSVPISLTPTSRPSSRTTAPLTTVRMQGIVSPFTATASTRPGPTVRVTLGHGNSPTLASYTLTPPRSNNFANTHSVPQGRQARVTSNIPSRCAAGHEASLTPSTTPVLAMLRNSADLPDSAHNSGTAAERETSTPMDAEVITQHILTLSRDQQGCRVLQTILETESGYKDVALQGNPAEVHRRFNNSIPIQRMIAILLPELPKVMADAYGNFLVQKLFEVAPSATRQRLLRSSPLAGRLVSVACSSHGTFAVQRLIETLRCDEEESLVFGLLQQDLLHLLTEINGGHVLCKMMLYAKHRFYSQMNRPLDPAGGSTSEVGLLPPSSKSPLSSTNEARLGMRHRVEFLYKGIRQHLLHVCCHKQGCCILQKCIDFFSQVFPADHSATNEPMESMSGGGVSDSNYFVGLVESMLPHIVTLSTDPYGNYVVTHAVDVCYTKGSVHLVDAIASAMQCELTTLCVNKFASNVVEHILRYCNEARIRAFCEVIMTPKSMPSKSTAEIGIDGSIKSPLVDIVMDSFGNYVVQTLLTVAPVDELLPSLLTGREEDNVHGVLHQLHTYLPFIRERSFGKKVETKLDLAMLRVAQQQQHPAMR